MAGQTNFPTALDDDVSLYDVTDGSSTLLAVHHNNLKEAVKAIEAKLGIYVTSSVTTVDYRLGHPTGGHIHDGASGQAPAINPSTIAVPTYGFPSGLSLYDHLLASAYHSPDHYLQFVEPGSVATGYLGGVPFALPRQLQLVSYAAILRLAPSGATTAFKVYMGPTDVMGASVGLLPVFAPGATAHFQPSPNLVSIPSGAVVRIHVDARGSNNPGQDLSVTFRFREQ